MPEEKGIIKNIQEGKYHLLTLIAFFFVIVNIYFQKRYADFTVLPLDSATLGIIFLLLEAMSLTNTTFRKIADKNKGDILLLLTLLFFINLFSSSFSDLFFLIPFLLIGYLGWILIILKRNSSSIREAADSVVFFTMSLWLILVIPVAAGAILLFYLVNIWFQKTKIRIAISLFIAGVLSLAIILNRPIEYLIKTYIPFLFLFLAVFLQKSVSSSQKNSLL